MMIQHDTTESVVDTVVRGLRQQRPTSFMIEVPAGCEDKPDIAARLRSRIETDPFYSKRLAIVTADTARDDSELATLLIGEWTRQDEEIRGRWDNLRGDVSELSAPHLLKAFFSLCVRSPSNKRISIIRRFDRMFGGMSRELLATIRDLENELLVVSVNVSPLIYQSLYRIRAEKEIGFTSDYGQTHVRISVGPLSRDAASYRWQSDYGLPSDGIHKAYFEIAYRFSGGLPAAFDVAINCVRNLSDTSSSVRDLKIELIDQSPVTFERLLRYLGPTLCEAVARMHLGVEDSKDRNLVCSSRWSFLLVDEASPDATLRSDAIGVKAVEMLKESRNDESISPEFLYEMGEYAACREALERSGQNSRSLLWNACNMMKEIFRHSPQNLYFPPNTNWNKVQQLAKEAIDLSSDSSMASEFSGWLTIATALRPPPSDELFDSAVRLALRVIAVQRDPISITAAYSAVPLIEEALRLYLRGIFKVSDIGSAFQDIGDREISDWWREDNFVKPDLNKKLTGTNLALLAAILSARKQQPLFSAVNTLHSILSALSGRRNRLGHYVDSPDETIGKDLATRARDLIQRILKDGNLDISLDEIERWVRPPKSFLGNWAS